MVHMKALGIGQDPMNARDGDSRGLCGPPYLESPVGINVRHQRRESERRHFDSLVTRLARKTASALESPFLEDLITNRESHAGTIAELNRRIEAELDQAAFRPRSAARRRDESRAPRRPSPVSFI